MPATHNSETCNHPEDRILDHEASIGKGETIILARTCQKCGGSV